MRWIVRAAGAGLVGFHGWLLAAQWQAGRLHDPTLLARWAAGLVLVAGLFWLSRQGSSLFSRRTVIMWLLAALLHAPAIASRTGGVDLRAIPEAAAAMVLQTSAIAGALVAAAWLLAGRSNGPRACFPPRFDAPISCSLACLLDGHATAVTARPPPRA